MTNKEWLKNITPKYLDLNGNVLLMLDGSVLMMFEDYYWLIKQAKLVQELEQQNKRYREAIERALDESGWGDEGNALHKMISILAKALEGEE